VTAAGVVRDLHYVDLQTLQLVPVATTGQMPAPAASPLMVHYGKFILIWAGTTGSNSSVIHILDTETLVWSRVQADCPLRSGACAAVVNDVLYIFGVSLSMTILTMNLKDFKLSVVVTTGVEPWEIEDLSAVTIGNKIFAFETIGIKAKTRLFVFDCERHNWLCFSVSLGAPIVEGNTPRIVFYIRDKRKLLAVWESQDLTSQPMTELHVGEPLAQLNQHLDLLKVLPRSGRSEIV
jgi:hypothetical protein